MKKNIFQTALAALFIGVLAVSCAKEKDNDSAIQKPVLVSISADTYFTGTTAEVKATLTQAIDVPVTVVLAADTKLSKDYTIAIDPELISPSDIVIPAGATEATATISVDNSSLEKGKYETQIVAVSAMGANMSSSSKANILLLQGSSTVSIAYNDYYSKDGHTTFTVYLDMYSEEDCVVKIDQLKMDLPSFPDLPLMAFKYDKEVTIKAGELEAVGNAWIDLDGLYESGSYAAALQIKGVTSKTEGKFDVSTSKYYCALAYSFTCPKKNHRWNIEYLGQGTVDKQIREIFYVSGVDGYFDYLISSSEAEEVNSFIFPNIITDENSYLASQIKAGKKIEDLCPKDEGYVTPSKRAAGTYKIWIVAVDESGVCTGEYAVKEFTVNPDPEPTDMYLAWLGDWTVGSTAEDEEPVVITISQKDVNQTYNIDYLEGINTVRDAMSVVAQLEEDGSISIYPQVVGTWSHPDYGKITDVLAGLFVSAGGTYYVPDSTTPVATGVISSNGSATLSAGSYYDSEEGSLYSFVGMKYFYVFSNGQAGQYTEGYTDLPNTLIPMVPNAATTEAKNVMIDAPKPGAEHSLILGTLTDAVRVK